MVMQNPWHDVSVGDEAPKIVNAIIEIPKEGTIKYELDKKSGMLKLDRFLYSSVHYPGDYGFVPRTLWYDNDPLDIIILTTRAVHPMTLAKVRIIGVLRMVDDDEKDDKLIGVYDSNPRYDEFQDIKDVPKHVMSELTHFFETYKLLQGKKVKVLHVLDKSYAHKDIEIGKKLYNMKFNPKKEKKEVNGINEDHLPPHLRTTFNREFEKKN